MHRHRRLESDWFYHQPPTFLKGGKIIKWDNPDEIYAAIQLNVRALGEIQPFTRYRAMVRRHVPVEVLGLPLKFKVVGNVPFDPTAYTGFRRETFNNVGIGVDEGDVDGRTPDVGNGYGGRSDLGLPYGNGYCGEDNVEIIERHVLSEIFPAVMFGFGNTATVDDVMLNGNEPLPFIEFYVNDEGRFVIMPFAEPRRRKHPRGVVIRDVEVTTMPFTAKTLEYQRNLTEFERPVSHRSGELFVQGSFCGSHAGRGHGRLGW